MSINKTFIIFLVSWLLICFSCSKIQVGDVTDGGIFISGESFVFTGTEEKEFYYSCKSIKSVYSYDKNGNQIFYNENDYEVENNKLKRTEFSRIPDFENYKVILNENGKFSFNDEPRNPPLIINYTVYVDYVANVNDFTIDNKKNILKDVNDDGNLKIMVCGDSIAAGAQTISQYYSDNLSDSFSGLLGEYLKFQNIDCEIENTSLVGSDISLLTQQI